MRMFHRLVGRRPSVSLALALLVATVPGRLRAQAHGHDHDDHDHEHAGLHFTHPLFTESVSPDTKVRLDYGRLNGDASENEAELEGEWTFTESFSIEVGVHYHLWPGPVVLGAGLAVPVTGEEYSTRLLVSAFWHF